MLDCKYVIILYLAPGFSRWTQSILRDQVKAKKLKVPVSIANMGKSCLHMRGMFGELLYLKSWFGIFSYHLTDSDFDYSILGRAVLHIVV